MTKKQRINAVRYAVNNFHCGECNTGVVQIFSKSNLRGEVTTTVSGCLDCGKEYGLRSASYLNPLPHDYDTRWA